MGVCESIREGMILDAPCPDCGHSVSLHSWPERLCSGCCIAVENDDLRARVEDLERLVGIRHADEAQQALEDDLGRLVDAALDAVNRMFVVGCHDDHAARCLLRLMRLVDSIGDRHRWERRTQEVA